MDIFRDKEGRSNIRLIVLVFVVLSGIAAALILYPPIPTKTEPDKTSGDITFTDSAGNPLSGGIELSGAGLSSGLKPNVNFISWTNVPNARVYYDALNIKDVSVNLRIAGNSPKGKVMLENYAVTIPKGVNTTPPGTLVKYVEISAAGISFIEADITIQYTDAEVNGINESTLTLYRYDIAAEAWSELPATIDEKNNILGATVNSLSIFAVSTKIPGKIEVRDITRAPVVSDIKTYDEAKNLKKAEKASLLSAADIPARGELEVDALKTKSVAVKLKVKTPGSGEIILEDYGRRNPVAAAPPGNTIKYVDIGAVNIDFESAEVRIAYTNAELGGADENTLIIYHWNGASWEALPTTIDAANNILTAATTSLSPFAASAGEGGAARVLVGTNRFVILDDPKVGKNESGFVQPSWGGYPAWTQWTGKNTMINATALYMDKNGTPVQGINITFIFYDPNATVNTTKYSTTNSLGMANVSLQMNDFSFYGRWKVRAGNGTLNSSNTTFIYNWWGCAFGGGTCGYGGSHLGDGPGGLVSDAPANSPYLSGRERVTDRTGVHNAATTNCTFCHRSFDNKNGGPDAPNALNLTNYASDVHRNITCTNAGCHGNYAVHGTTAGTGNMLIASCYNASGGCHTPANRSDISNKSTLNSSNVATALSLYSINSTSFNATFHTPNSTVPCIICHGPMHNISKPDITQNFTRNKETETSQCITCHSSYQKHNASVNCTVCHSDDVHDIQVFAQNGTYIELNKSNPNPARGNCTNCHQNATFLLNLTNLTKNPKAGYHDNTSLPAPQINVPINHSDDINAGRKWNQTPIYWINGTSGSAQNSSCLYCHGRTMHNTSALGRPSLFDGNNIVNSTISSSTYWCASCHYQSYSSGANTYNDTVSTFNFPGEPLLVPPEITGNASFGANQSISAYFNHSGFSTYADSKCDECHPTSSTTITAFMHNVPVGSAGDVNCTNCHNVGGSQNNVNFTALNLSMHANLNKNATGNATNKPCWGCHGTKNGTYANESDQPVGQHNATQYKNPRKCYDCHITGILQFNAVNVTDHIPSGYTSLTDVNTSSYNNTYCSYCHNNSANTVSDDTARGITGTGSPINASTSHYGANATANKLMSATNNSTDCVYCHRNSSNMAQWGILNGSRANISNKNGTGGDTNHNSYTSSSQCPTCHGGFTVTAGFTFHNSALGNGSGGGPNCISCHDKGGSGAPGDKWINASDMKLGVHKNLNSNASNVTALDSINKACWACHGDGAEPGGHPTNYNSPYVCIDCHNRTSNLTYTTNATIKTDLNKKKVAEHIQSDYYENISSTRNNSAVNCTFCHNKSLVAFNDTASINIRSNISHYATNTSLVSPTTNCNYCHKDASNASNYYSNVTRHPARTSDVSYCGYCHNNSLNNTNATSFHSQSLDFRFGSTASIHGGAGSINYWGFDWEQDDWNETSVAREDEGCYACHKTGEPPRLCENCHLPDTSNLFTGPRKDTGLSLNTSINDSIPRIYSHTNYSSVNVPNQSQGTASSCYGLGGMSCHGVDYGNKSIAGGYFAFNYLWDFELISSDVAHFTNTIDRLPNTTGCLFCHNQSNPAVRAAWGNATQVNASTMFGASTNASCYSCHTSDKSTPKDLHANTIVSGGGPGCLGCHNTSTPQNYTGMHYIDGGSFNNSVHSRINQANSTVNGTDYGINASCWACHNSSGYAVANNTHPDKRDTPYNCTDCHLAGGINAQAYNATMVSEHFINGTGIRTGNATSNISSCINCHENASEMIITNSDTDTGLFTGDGIRLTGGNKSYYHYGKPRTDLRTWDSGTSTNCTYCHQNITTSFKLAMTDQANNSNISNHSTIYSSSPACTACHNTGWLHNSTLTKPVFALPNSSYCLTCHGSGGSATIKNLEQHNSTSSTAPNCTQCHLNTSRSIHPVRYLQTDLTWNTTRTNAVNCTTCHQTGLTGFENATRIPAPMNHSTNNYSGALWNNTPGYWTNTSQQSACNYCHNKSALHNATGLGSITKVKGNNTKNQSLDTGTWCANCHYAGATGYAGTAFYPEPPEILNASGKVPSKASDNTNFYNHTSAIATGYNDSKCKNCHNNNLDSGATSLNFSHNVAAGGGGPNCTGCHYIGAGVQNINVTAITDASSIHKDLNKNASVTDNGYNDSKKCWSCHGDGNEPTGHPSRYKTPYNCTDCHVTGQNQNFTPNTILTVTQHYWNGSSIVTSAATSCYACHNTTGMITPAYDPDGASSNVYGGSNGGNNSVSHYGKKRDDMSVQQNTASYCYNCHNGSTSFPFIDNANRTISNHSTLYPTTNPDCTDCHNTGRIHNSTLTKPAFVLPNSTYCLLSCHGAGGSATIKNLEQHNATSSTAPNCTQCHLNTSRSIHPVRYLQTDLTWNTTRTNAVNCTTCHQTGLTGFENATRIPAPMNHSTNNYSGALWNNTPGYWTNTSQQSACNYCHGAIALHNASGLGNITKVQGTNTKNQNLSTGTWCANCHYAGATGYAGTAFYPEPPEILNASGKVPNKASDNTNFYNHSSAISTGYNDSKCKNCHNNNLDSGATSLNFSHNVAQSIGGPNCTGCHYIGASVQNINVTAITDASSIHKDLNKNASVTDNGYNDSKKCWSCHGDGSQPGRHPSRYKTPYNCTDCHVTGQNQNFTPNTILTVTQHYWNGSSIVTSAATSCYACHNTTGMITPAYDPDGASSNVYGGSNGGNNSVSHYGKKRNDMAVQQNTASYCYNCHNGSTSFPFIDNANRTISNHSTLYPTTNPDCTDCHNTGRIHNSTLTKPAFVLPNSSYCLTCHGSGGSATIKNLEQHNATSSTALNCTQCHLNTSRSIHPVRYLQTDLTWNTTRTNAVNCTTCHQTGLTGFENATRVPAPMNHSTNNYSGALWNNTPGYWTNTSQQSACNYCHNKSALHNASGLGNITKVKGSNTKNQNLSLGTWCANCHYGDATGYSGTQYYPRPPEVLNKSGLMPETARDGITKFINHSDFLSGGYNDSRCKDCHNNNLASDATSLNFSHNVAPGGGGPNCTQCHDISGSGAPNDKRINASAMRLGVHKNLNQNATNTTAIDILNKACWACHGTGEQPTGHPNNYNTPYACLDCHNRTSNLTFTANTSIKTDLNKKQVAEHIQEGYSENITSTRNNPSVNCTYCHNKSLAYFNISFTAKNYLAANLSHYATNTSLVSPTTNCNYCHKDAANASNYYSNVTRHPARTSDVSYCGYCHNNSLNNTLVTSFHSQSLDFRFGSTASIHGGAGSINYWGFDWEQDDWNETSVAREDEGCYACHKTGEPPRLCENCHLPDTSNLFTGPRKDTGLSLNTSINDSIPRIYSHTNYSSVNVPNQSQGTASSCYGLGGMSCHGVDYGNKSIAGGYFAFNYLWDFELISSDVAHFTNTIDRLPNTTGCLFCHNQSTPAVRAAWGNATQVNASTMFGASTNASCYSCHTSDKSTPKDLHANTIVSGGGPGCLGCHNASTPQNYTGMHYIDGGSFNNSVHSRINQANSTVNGTDYGINASCWACHNSSGYAVANNTHPDKRDTPYNCTDCHLAGGINAQAYNATIIYNHYRNGTTIRALDNKTTDLASCIGCHENVSGMRVPNNDTDYGLFTGDGIGLTGGNTSFYHYGKNRTSFNKTAGSYEYCIYCHRNTTGEFNITFQDTANYSISNHSMGYGSSPSCSRVECHNSTNFTLHGSQLAKPSLILPNSSYCLGCHGNNGAGGTNYSGAATAYKEKHNNTVDCTKCHLNNSKSIHPVRYLQEGGSEWITTNSSAVNCTTCHQGSVLTNFSTAPKVSNTVQHSDNSLNGSIWNSTSPYWTNTSQQSMCNYCHGDTRHNTTPLGRPNNWRGDNTVNSSLTNNSNWCAGCHYQWYSNSGKDYSSMTLTFVGANKPVPPEITNHTSYAPYNVNGYYNHSLTPDYNDSTCKECHSKSLSINLIKDFVHNVSIGVCTNCHYSYEYMSSVGKAERFVNQSMFEASPHRNVSCESCHTKGHNNTAARKACEDCHAVQQNPTTDTDRHNITRDPWSYKIGGVSVVNITTCTTCHNETVYNEAVQNFGPGQAKQCQYCHTYPDKTYS